MSQPNQVTLEIESDSGGEQPNNNRSNAMLLRLDSTPRAGAPNRNTISERLTSVFREIRPLVENARRGNNARLSLPTWLPRSSAAPTTSETNLQRPQSTIAHVNLGPASQTYTITERETPQRQHSHPISTSASNESNLSDAEGQQDVTISVNPANNNNINDNEENNESQSENDETNIDLLGSTLESLIKYAPFYFIVFLKFMYDRREGLFTFFILFFTFSHGNALVRREHGKQMSRSQSALFFELFFTIGTVAIVHFLFGHDMLLPNVIMFPGYEEPMDIWDLLWLVVLTDLILKIITVDVKLLVTMMPATVLPFQKRGKVYLFVESVSQLYRALLTIQPWMDYLMRSYEGSEKMVGMFLTSFYVISKVIELLCRLNMFKNATKILLQSVNLGTKPTGEQLLSAGESCPICHDDFSTPVRLGCTHIFCELCIAAWLDREHTCPLCRAKVADEPTWRDGSTTHDLQLY